jgi:hypothetical protein
MTRKMKRNAAILGVLLGLVAGGANASILSYSALLNGASESPSNNSSATGNATVTVDDVLNTMRVQVSFSVLSGDTTVAHIHCCTTDPMTGTAGVATATPSFAGFPAGVKSGSYDQTFDLTASTSYRTAFITANGNVSGAKTALLAGLAANMAYFNLHTQAFTGGEIRGFLVASVPTLLCFGLVGIGAVRRKQA